MKTMKDYREAYKQDPVLWQRYQENRKIYAKQYWRKLKSDPQRHEKRKASRRKSA